MNSWKITIYASVLTFSAEATSAAATRSAPPAADPAVHVGPSGLSLKSIALQAGKLVIQGKAAAAGVVVTIPATSFHTTALPDRSFAFGILYRTPDCRLKLATKTGTLDALIGNCGPGVLPRGSWNSKRVYAASDLTVFRGTTYRALRLNRAVQPDISPFDWQVFAARGENGLAGLRGPKGDKGLKGDAGSKGEKGAQGQRGVAGAQGVQGKAGIPGIKGDAGIRGPMGPSGIVAVAAFSGPVQATVGGNGSFVFAGPQATVSVEAGQKLTGSASVPLGSASGKPLFKHGLCYQSGANPPLNFAGANSQVSQASNVVQTFSSSASVADLPAGAYQVGFCVQNDSRPNHALTGNGYVNGWVMVHN